MVIIVVAKIFATGFTISSGGSGGVFAPSMVIGGMLGGALGQAFFMLSPSEAIDLTYKVPCRRYTDSDNIFGFHILHNSLFVRVRKVQSGFIFGWKITSLPVYFHLNRSE